MRHFLLAGGALAFVALAVPAVSSGDTTISAVQPQGPALTSQRTSYVVRASNETDEQNTYKLTLFVPPAAQLRISIKHDSNWRITLAKKRTGAKPGSGVPAYMITRVTWTAKTRADEIAPFEYGEWAVRIQNPSIPLPMCFGFWQYYRNARTGSRQHPKVVKWTGREGSETPGTCIQTVDPASSQ